MVASFLTEIQTVSLVFSPRLGHSLAYSTIKSNEGHRLTDRHGIGDAEGRRRSTRRGGGRRDRRKGRKEKEGDEDKRVDILVQSTRDPRQKCIRIKKCNGALLH